jgi:hypothetical protein
MAHFLVGKMFHSINCLQPDSSFHPTNRLSAAKTGKSRLTLLRSTFGKSVQLCLVAATALKERGE